MMKVMNESGRKAVTFVFAGYQKEMGEFIQYNAGLESRIKYKFHFADYTVPELVTITNIKLKAKGYKLAADGDQLITLTKSDLATAIGRFATARPPVKKDP